MGIAFRGREPLEVGNKYNHWTVLEVPDLPPSREAWNAKALCRCDCGREKHVRITHLVLGRSAMCKSCSIRKIVTTHGASDSGGHHAAHRLYRIWKVMKWRCSPKSPDKSGYYDRGIAVCPEWKDTYEPFRDWALANGYCDNLTIDRRDNDRGYSADNCRWIGYQPQARNTRRNRRITAFGETRCVCEWAEDPRCSVTQSAIHLRLARGWPEQDAVALPRARPPRHGGHASAG